MPPKKKAKTSASSRIQQFAQPRPAYAVNAVDAFLPLLQNSDLNEALYLPTIQMGVDNGWLIPTTNPTVEKINREMLREAIGILKNAANIQHVLMNEPLTNAQQQLLLDSIAPFTRLPESVFKSTVFKPQKEIVNQEMHDIQFPASLKGPVCTRCGSDQTQIRGVQHRAADEPETYVFNCFTCGLLTTN